MSAPNSDPMVSLNKLDDFSRNVWSLLGLPIDVLTIAQTTTLIDKAADGKQRLSFVTPNVNWLVNVSKDKAMRRMIIDADLSVIDGAPLVAIAKRLGIPVSERVAGSDLFLHLMQNKAEKSPLSVFFFGGREGAAQAADMKINQGDTAIIRSAGWLNPGFGDIDAMSTPEIINQINQANVDFLIVSLGAVKGQQWIDHNLSRLNVPVISHLGAVVDFTAGTITRAPQWVSKAGFEWLWRIFAEPALWKRYAGDGAILTKLVATRMRPSKTRDDLGSCDAQLVQGQQGQSTIKLKGALTHANLPPIRDCFRQASLLGQSITLDFRQVTVMDLAFLGLCLMLEKHQTRQHKEILLTNIAPALQSMFLRNQMEYPILEKQ